MVATGVLVSLVFIVLPVVIFAAAMEWILGSFNDNDIQE